MCREARALSAMHTLNINVDEDSDQNLHLGMSALAFKAGFYVTCTKIKYFSAT